MLHTIAFDNLSLTVDTKWAEIKSLTYKNREFIYQITDGYWQRQSPHLFPIVGAILDGTFEYKWQSYHLPQHGFVRDRVWELSDISPDSIEFSIRDDSETMSWYPFHFWLKVWYTLSYWCIMISYMLENRGDEDMYYGLWAHPAFALEAPISSYHLRVSDGELWVVRYLTRGLLSQEIAPFDTPDFALSEELFDRDALIFLEPTFRKIWLYQGDRCVLMLDRGDFPYFALWRQKNSPFLCLEPWAWHADMVWDGSIINQKSGKRKLLSRHSVVYTYTLQLEKAEVRV